MPARRVAISIRTNMKQVRAEFDFSTYQLAYKNSNEELIKYTDILVMNSLLVSLFPSCLLRAHCRLIAQNAGDGYTDLIRPLQSSLIRHE